MSLGDQDRLLEESLKLVENEAQLMNQSLKNNELMEGLKHASIMLGELRTSALSPKNYYKLFIDVTLQLSNLETHLNDQSRCGINVSELYELVQYAGNIIPRLYLLITVGTVFLNCGHVSKKQLLCDLVEMCRGVQQPLRGLFLRNYLLQHMKNFLPDVPNIISENDSDNSAADDGTISDAIEAVMTNFSEMNKLWVRMQYQGHSREKEKREAERRELRILVGSNLVTLSQLDNMNLEIYKQSVLPQILEQAISCSDPLAQEYLMECVIQVFPDSYHLDTLSDFLYACKQLEDEVQLKRILGLLISRIAAYVTDEKNDATPTDSHLFEIFSKHVEDLILSKKSLPPDDIVCLQGSIIDLAIRCWPENSEYATIVYSSLVSVLETLKIHSIVYGTSLGKETVKFLKIPIDLYTNPLNVFKIDNYIKVLNFLDYRGRTFIASEFLKKIIENDEKIKNDKEMINILQLTNCLMIDQPDQMEDIDGNEDFMEEQGLLSRLPFYIDDLDFNNQLDLLKKLKRALGNGGKHRIKYTLPSIVNCVLDMARKYDKNSTDVDEIKDEFIMDILKFVMTTINSIYLNGEMAVPAFRYYLQAAISAGKLHFNACESVVYELITKAFSLFEEDISDSKEQQDALYLLIGTIGHISCLSEENHAPLRNQCFLAVNKMLRKPDQAKMICSVASLYWEAKITEDGEVKCVHNGGKVIDCFKKALKVTSQCMEEIVQITLYIHILNSYSYFYENGCTEITIDTIKEMTTKIKNNIEALDYYADKSFLKNSLDKILDHIKNVKEVNPESVYKSLTLE
uniref:Vacuolar protein sorting-associated protein 35 n=1 Tax=Parastrongyloides trichosuri TaxID=131310 RepID=A0A0N4ZA51_PARTI